MYYVYNRLDVQKIGTLLHIRRHLYHVNSTSMNMLPTVCS